MVDGVDLLAHRVEHLGRQAEQRPRQVPDERNDPVGQRFVPQGVRVEVRAKALRALLGGRGPHQAVHRRPRLLEQLPEEKGAEEARGAGEEDVRRLDGSRGADLRSDGGVENGLRVQVLRRRRDRDRLAAPDSVDGRREHSNRGLRE